MINQVKTTLFHLHDPLLTQLRLPVGSDRVQDHTVLPAAQGGHVHHSDHLLGHRGDVRLPVGHGDQPLLPCAALTLAGVFEGSQGANMKRFLRTHNKS